MQVLICHRKLVIAERLARQLDLRGRFKFVHPDRDHYTPTRGIGTGTRIYIPTDTPLPADLTANIERARSRGAEVYHYDGLDMRSITRVTTG